MLRKFVGLVAGGLAVVLGLKLFAALLMPLVGLFLGLFALAIKLALVGAIAYFVYALVRDRKRVGEA